MGPLLLTAPAIFNGSDPVSFWKVQTSKFTAFPFCNGISRSCGFTFAVKHADVHVSISNTNICNPPSSSTVQVDPGVFGYPRATPSSIPPVLLNGARAKITPPVVEAISVYMVNLRTRFCTCD